MKFRNLLGCILLLAILGVSSGGNQNSALGSVIASNYNSTTHTEGADGKITGNVTDSLGVPMSDVFVTLISDTGKSTSIQHTDASGSYTLSGIASGSYKVQFVKYGYAEIWYSGAASRTSGTVITVTAPDTTSGIDGVLGIGGKITGKVKDSSGTPMSGVMVSLHRATDNFVVTAHSTDISGNYTFYGLASGSYNVRFEKPDHTAVWYSSATSRASAAVITVTEPDTTSGIDGAM